MTRWMDGWLDDENETKKKKMLKLFLLWGKIIPTSHDNIPVIILITDAGVGYGLRRRMDGNNGPFIVTRSIYQKHWVEDKTGHNCRNVFVSVDESAETGHACPWQWQLQSCPLITWPGSSVAWRGCDGWKLFAGIIICAKSDKFREINLHKHCGRRRRRREEYQRWWARRAFDVFLAAIGV